MSQTTPMRRKERCITDKNAIRAILDRCSILHLGLYDEDRIYVVPVNYSYTYEEGTLTLYFHGAQGGLKHDILKVRPEVGFEIDDGGTLVPHPSDPSQYTSHYASLIGSGQVTEITDIEEKKQTVSRFMKHYSPKDWTITDRMVLHTALYRLDVTEFQAKGNGVTGSEGNRAVMK